MDSDPILDPGEDPESVHYMEHDNQTKRTREEIESDNEENPISKQPKNKEAGWKTPAEPQPTTPAEPQPITSNNLTNMESGRQALHWASCGGHEEIASFLIEHGAPVDSADDCGWTPLMIASSAGREQVVRLLIGRGADVNFQNNGDHSALQYASSKDHYEIVPILLDHGANVNMQDNMGATALHRASSKGNVRVMVRLLQCNMCSVNIQDKEGNTPLHLACEEERLAAVRLLLEHNASTSMVNKAGKSPLQMTNTSLRHLTHMNEL